MGVGSSFTSAYNNAKRQTGRSYMPMINTLSGMIRNSKARTPKRRGRRYARRRENYASDTDIGIAEREAKAQAEKYEERRQYEEAMDQQRLDQIMAKEENRVRAEQVRTEEDRAYANTERQQAQGERTKGIERNDRKAEMQDAYEMAKQGLMIGDNTLVTQGLRQLLPAGEDQITESTSEDGTRKFTGRPEERNVPEFLFHPEGYVGVVLPGKEKPIVFENVEEAFKKFLSPMNPSRYQDASGGGKKSGGSGLSGRDIVAQEKNQAEAGYKNKKLEADAHNNAHKGAMEQFNMDGVYQQELFNQEEYDRVYNDLYFRETGKRPKEATTAAGEPYKGSGPPKGFPDAVKGPNGGWIIQKEGKWYPIQGKGKKGAGGKKEVVFPRRKKKPVRSKMDAKLEKKGRDLPEEKMNNKGGSPTKEQMKTADKAEVPEGEKVYRGSFRPPHTPGAHYDKKAKAWYYLGDNQEWKVVTI